MKKTGPTSEHMVNLINDLRREGSAQKAGIWKRVAEDLSKASRSRRVVNLSKLNRFTKENEVVVVPGKVLGAGALNHSLTVAAFSFSESAKKSIADAKGKAITLNELLKLKPKGKDVRIIG